MRQRARAGTPDRASREDAHQLLRRGIRQRTDQHPIDDGEDGCVESDAESQRQHCRGRGDRMVSEHAHGIRGIPSGIVHPPERPGIAVQLLGVIDTSEG